MTLNEFIKGVKSGHAVDFKDSMAIIAEHYAYQPAEFSNGLQQPVINQAGQNEGSCKIFAFAKLQGLNQAQTLALFGDFYRKDVLENPDGTDHQNIRNFIRDGWPGIAFKSEALMAKHAD